MTGPREFKAANNPKERIWQEADRLRIAHLAGRSAVWQSSEAASLP